MKRSTLSHSLLNVILVFIESALTLLLRLDPDLRKAAYPLAKNGTLVCLRLYLPHTEVYATFSYKGILLDANLPSERSEPDVIINAYSIQILNAITTHDVAQVNKLQMRGEASQVELVKSFLLQLGLGSLLHSLINKIKGQQKQPAKDGKQDEQKQDDYKLRISEQQTQINALTKKNRELETCVKELHSKQKTLFITLAVVSLVAIGALIGLFAN